jgi:type VI protein secretion system component VasK
MSDCDLPASTLATIEQRVKRRIRRQLTMAVLTLALAFTLFMASATQWSPDRQVWGMMSGILLLVWIPYVLWYVYRALGARGVRREIERERQHQLHWPAKGVESKRRSVSPT